MPLQKSLKANVSRKSAAYELSIGRDRRRVFAMGRRHRFLTKPAGI
jgi:hypothetical protein